MLGIEALGVERGASILETVVSHLDGLAYVSPPQHFEFGALPLDCHHPSHCTREDVLRYYARLVNWGRLRVLQGHRCLALESGADTVAVVTDTAGRRQRIVADHVIVTSWYRRRGMTFGATSAAHRPRVVTSFRNAIELAGEKVVLIGRGLSAYEHAVALMSNGATITMLSHGHAPYHARDDIRQLVRATGSVCLECSEDIQPHANGITITTAGDRRRIECDVIVHSRGAELDEDALAMLERSGTLKPHLVDQLRRAPTFEDALRLKFSGGRDECIAWLSANRPDLWEQLFDGRRRVYLAGGALHAGGQHAGIASSIATARLAVRALAGYERPSWSRPLMAALADHAAVEASMRTQADMQALLAVRPSRARTSRETAFGRPLDGVRREGQGPTGQREFTRTERDVFALVDDERSVSDILARATDAGICRSDDLALAALRSLWYHSALTWSAPIESPPSLQHV